MRKSVRFAGSAGAMIAVFSLAAAIIWFSPATQAAPPAPASGPAAEWRVMPIRTEEESRRGAPGGEAEQHPHSITRSPRDPNILYLSHDCCQAWKRP